MNNLLDNWLYYLMDYFFSCFIEWLLIYLAVIYRTTFFIELGANILNS